MSVFKYRQRWYRQAQLNHTASTNRVIPPQLTGWLFDVSSLTARLIAQYGKAFNVRLLSQSYTLINADEKAALGLFSKRAALVREVLLCDNQTPLVYARTIIPVSTLSGPLRRYANLGERPLGAILFADRTMRRGEVEVTSTLPQHCCAGKKLQLNNKECVIWGRRSVFRVSGKPLLVSEYFLPALFASAPTLKR